MGSARLGPAMISTLGHRGSQKAPTRSPASPGAIRPGSTLIEEVRFATVSPPEGDDSNPRSPIYGELAARGRARHAPCIGIADQSAGAGLAARGRARHDPRDHLRCRVAALPCADDALGLTDT